MENAGGYPRRRVEQVSSPRGQLSSRASRPLASWGFRQAELSLALLEPRLRFNRQRRSTVHASSIAATEPHCVRSGPGTVIGRRCSLNCAPPGPSFPLWRLRVLQWKTGIVVRPGNRACSRRSESLRRGLFCGIKKTRRSDRPEVAWRQSPKPGCPPVVQTVIVSRPSFGPRLQSQLFRTRRWCQRDSGRTRVISPTAFVPCRSNLNSATARRKFNTVWRLLETNSIHRTLTHATREVITVSRGF